MCIYVLLSYQLTLKLGQRSSLSPLHEINKLPKDLEHQELAITSVIKRTCWDFGSNRHLVEMINALSKHVYLILIPWSMFLFFHFSLPVTSYETLLLLFCLKLSLPLMSKPAALCKSDD